MAWYFRNLPVKKDWVIATVLWVVAVILFTLQTQHTLFSNSFYDDQRDLLVASHISGFGEKPEAGPFAAGGFGILRYTTVPYYLYGLVYGVFGGLSGMLIFWHGLIGMFVPLVYLVIRNAFASRWVGLMIAGTILIHPGTSIMAGSIFTPYLQPVLITIWLAAIALPMQPIQRLCIGAASMISGLLFHMTAFVWVPVALVWWFSVFFDALKQRSSRGIWVVAVVFWGFLALWGATIDIANIVSSNSWQLFFSVQNSVIRIGDVWSAAVTFMIGNDVTLARGAFSMLIAVGVLIMHPPRKASAVNRWALGGFIFSLFIFGLYGGYIHPWYHFVLLPYIIFPISALISFLGRYKSSARILCIVLVVCWAIRAYTINRDDSTRGMYGPLTEIAGVIQAQSSDMDYRIYFVKHAPWGVYDEWESGGLWYLLEKNTGTRFVRLSDAPHSFTPLANPVTTFYIVCDQRVIDMYSAPDRCTELMQRLGRETSFWKSWNFIYASGPYIVVKATPPVPLRENEVSAFMRSQSRLE